MGGVTISRDGGWSTATYPGDPDRPEFTVSYRRYTEADRLVCLRWESMALEMIGEGFPTESICAELAGVKRLAMASRLRDPETGEEWTPETIGDVGGASQAAYDWLEGLLYRPFWRELTVGKVRKRLVRSARLQRRIHLGLRSVARSA